MTVTIFLGSNGNDEVELDSDDELYIRPIAASMGGVWDIPRKKAFRVIHWNGIKQTQQYVHYETIPKKDAQKLADELYEKNNKNTNHTIISIKASEVNDFVMKYFRFVQSETSYEDKPVPLPAGLIGRWLSNEKLSIGQLAKMFKVKSETIEDIFYNLNIVDDKFIPRLYLENSKQVRMELLHGLMNVDQQHDYRRIDLHQKSERLTNDIVQLAKSLGMFAVKSKKYLTESETTYEYYRIMLYPMKKDTEDTSVSQGIKISKTKSVARNIWTDEMRKILMDCVENDAYKKKTRINWIKIKEDHKCFEMLSTDALKVMKNDLKKKL